MEDKKNKNIITRSKSTSSVSSMDEVVEEVAEESTVNENGKKEVELTIETVAEEKEIGDDREKTENMKQERTLLNEIDLLRKENDELKLQMEKNNEQLNKRVETLEKLVQALQEENKQLVQSNRQNMEKKDEMIERLDKENQEMRDVIQQLNTRNKRTEADKVGVSVLLDEAREEVKKVTAEKQTIIKQKSQREKETTKAQDETRQYKELAEELKCKQEEQRRTINNLNNYLDNVKGLNKELLEKSSPQSSNHVETTASNVNSRQQQVNVDNSNNSKKIKLYIGNIDAHADTEQLKQVLNIDTNVDIEFNGKERKTTRVRCREEENGGRCKYGHACKWVHIGEENETLRYCTILVDEDKKDEYLQLNNSLLLTKKLIIEEVPNITIKKTEKKVCRFYLEDKCTRQNCIFLHPKECNSYKDGKCTYGQNCKYAHIKRENQTQNFGGVEGMLRYMAQFLPQRQYLPQTFSQITPPMR